jgi:MFS family permease
MAFAIFLMVKKFNFSVQEIAILFVINNAVNYFLSPLIGKGIIRFGERKILSLEYFSLIFIFSGYAIVQSKLPAAMLYILDHIFFNFSIAIRTYFQKIGDPKDIAPTMAVGFTINHIAAVVLPVLGGVLWMVDYRIPFILGAGLSFISLAAVQKINTNPSLVFSHKGTQRVTKKKNDRSHPNEKFLGVQNPFFKKGFGRRRQK